jgi:hypothetical protein
MWFSDELGSSGHNAVDRHRAEPSEELAAGRARTLTRRDAGINEDDAKRGPCMLGNQWKYHTGSAVACERIDVASRLTARRLNERFRVTAPRCVPEVGNVGVVSRRLQRIPHPSPSRGTNHRTVHQEEPHVASVSCDLPVVDDGAATRA